MRPLLLVVSLLVLGGAALLLSRCSKGPDAPPAPKIRNVVLISIDTLRPDRLGLHGYDRAVSPHLDAFGEAGVVFEECVAQAPWTAPSHASMLTSLYPSALNIGKFSDPGKVSPAARMLAEVFQEAGYQTCAVTGGGFVSRELGFDQGFEEFRTFQKMHLNVDHALKWLDRRDPQKPFFLFLHTYEVHHYAPPEEFAAEFVRPYDGPIADGRNVAKFVQNYQNRDQIAALTEADWRYVSDLYDACLASTDAAMGTFFAALKERGAYDETLFVLTSDHGEEFGERGYSGHGYTLYDENVLVPLVFHHGSLAPQRIDQQARVLDVAPTIAALAGLEAPVEYEGISLLEVIGGATANLVGYSENAHSPVKSVRTKSRKYIVSTKEPNRELYDLDADPEERTNLAGEEIAPEERRMRDGMVSWIEKNLRVRSSRAAQSTEMSPEMLAELEALGYIGGSGGTPAVDGADWLKLLKSE
ncbi:MAG: sulfatase [Planctomycetota bacterium JB042]